MALSAARPLRLRGSPLLILLAACSGWAQTASPWRVWTRADGLNASFTSSITSDSAGRIQIKQGALPVNGTLDGYRVVSSPSAKEYGRLRSDSDGNLWSFDLDGILIRDAAGWHKYPDTDMAAVARQAHLALTSWYLYDTQRDPQPDMRIAVAPLGNGLGLILLPDRLFEWDRTTRRKGLIRAAGGTALGKFWDLQKASDGGYWVTGDRGLAHLKRNGAAYEWREFPAPAGLREFLNPIEGRRDEVFMSAHKPDGNHVVMRYASGGWERLREGGSRPMRGWRGPDGSIWVQDGDVALQQVNSAFREVRFDTFSQVTNVLSRPNGDFWVAMRVGLARYSPPLWRTPPEVEWLNAPVASIAEDGQGRLWYVSDQNLLLNDHGVWSRIPLPAGARVQDTRGDALFVLPDGKLVIWTVSSKDFLVFNPAQKSFRTVSHPDGASLGMIARRDARSLWVQVFESDGLHWHMESFDGTGFHREGESEIFSAKDLRVFLVAHNGDIWVGSAGGLGVFRKGKFHTMGREQGFPDNGNFSALEAPDGKIYFGGFEGVTEYNGLSFRLIDKDETVRTLALTHEGVLWIGSNEGLNRFHAGQRVVNSASEGLPGTVYKVFPDSQGRIWAGAGGGIGLFHPEADPDPPIALIDDEQNLREAPPRGEVRIAFSGVDKWKYTPADLLTYSWRLDDSPWSEFSPSRFVSLKGLHSGAHRFEVRAMDRNANVSISPASFAFTVLLPWYRETQFQILAALALLIMAGLLRGAWMRDRKLKYQSRHDPLTGLANRAVFEPNLQQAIAEAEAEDCGAAMLLLDLDRFKPINDRLGHAVGDRFLKEVSRRLQGCIRSGDTLARLGGDEFAIVMPRVSSRREVEVAASRVLERLRQTYRIDSYELMSSASIGISLYPEHANNAATLQRLADMAMYQSKAQNRDRYTIFDPEVNRLDFRNTEMAGLIRQALENGYFRLDYQPFQTIDGELVGLEALVRIEHPQYGTIPPNDFIPIAEDTGLILRVGEWVLREACRQMSLWHQAGYRSLRVSVNVSAVQLARPDFAETVGAVLRESELDPLALTLEVTETAMLRNLKETTSQIKQLRDLGVAVALDDFGTGYSSLGTLHLLPVDYIKIDRSFIDRVGSEPGGLAVVESMIGLVHRCGFEVVAEGVEQAEQLDGLRSAGADFIQGFLLGRPLPADRARKLLDSREQTVER